MVDSPTVVFPMGTGEDLTVTMKVLLRTTSLELLWVFTLLREDLTTVALVPLVLDEEVQELELSLSSFHPM